MERDFINNQKFNKERTLRIVKIKISSPNVFKKNDTQ